MGGDIVLCRLIALRLARLDSELPNPPDYAANILLAYLRQPLGLVLMPIVIDLQFSQGCPASPICFGLVGVNWCWCGQYVTNIRRQKIETAC